MKYFTCIIVTAVVSFILWRSMLVTAIFTACSLPSHCFLIWSACAYVKSVLVVRSHVQNYLRVLITTHEVFCSWHGLEFISLLEWMHFKIQLNYSRLSITPKSRGTFWSHKGWQGWKALLKRIILKVEYLISKNIISNRSIIMAFLITATAWLQRTYGNQHLP